MKKENGILTEVTEQDLELLKNNPTEFWAGVSCIGEGAFKDLSLSEIIIPETVLEIKAGAFMACISLEEISIPKSVTEIGEKAFGGCVSLKRINGLEGVVEIKNNAFRNCKNLAQITLPQTLEVIGAGAFAYCGRLNEVNIPSNVSVDSYAFEGCAISKLNISKNAIIQPYGFSDCLIDELNMNTQSFSFDMFNETKINKLNIYENCNGIPLTGMKSYFPVKELTFFSPSSLIWSDGFSHLRGLKGVNLPEGVTCLNSVFNSCVNLEFVNLPTTLKNIEESCFAYCGRLKQIEIPEGVEEIGKSAFMASGLTDVKIPEKVTKIGARTFEDCKKLESVTLPRDLKTIGQSAFAGCEVLTGVDLPNGLETIDARAFAHTKITEIIIPNSVYNLGVKCFMGCPELENVTLSYGLDAIPAYAFAKCSKLTSITIPDTIKKINQKAFVGTNISYIKINNDVQVASDAFINTPIKYVTLTKDEKIFASTPQKVKGGVTIPYELYLSLGNNPNELNNFVDNGTTSVFYNEMKPYLEQLEGLTQEQRIIFYNFAYAMGCFSTEKLRDKSGKELQATKAQKRSSLLVALLNSKALTFEEIFAYFGNISPTDTISDDAIKFISNLNSKEYVNISMLKRLETHYPGIMYKSIVEFNSASKGRATINPITNKTEVAPWETALIKYFLKHPYKDVRPEDEEMAEIFNMHGLEQDVFDKGADLMETARERNIPSHILGKALKEKTILEELENLKLQTAEVLKDSKTLIDDLYSKKFTFEYLDKHDPINAIIGLYASCCATISSTAYGADIAEATITAEDVQNLVIRDSDGKIVAKGTLYINREQGYIVINDYEMNEQYRKDENETGYYTAPKDSQVYKDRELIFKAFMRGIYAFVEEYDKQNPDKPIQKVNVGMGYNRLKEQCKRYEKETNNLTVPSEYYFNDASFDQYILYKRQQEKIDTK